MAVVDIPGFISNVKDHAVDHNFHIHDERHFVETYSLQQVWEIDLHPEEACGGPVDLHLALEVDPRTLFSFEDMLLDVSDEVLLSDEINTQDLPHNLFLPLTFTWLLPPLAPDPDFLVLTTDLAGIGKTILPLEVSAIDSLATVTDTPERSLTIVSSILVDLTKIFLGEEDLCEILTIANNISIYLHNLTKY